MITSSFDFSWRRCIFDNRLLTRRISQCILCRLQLFLRISQLIRNLSISRILSGNICQFGNVIIDISDVILDIVDCIINCRLRSCLVFSQITTSLGLGVRQILICRLTSRISITNGACRNLLLGSNVSQRRL